MGNQNTIEARTILNSSVQNLENIEESSSKSGFRRAPWRSKSHKHVRSFSAGRDIFREHKTVNKRCSFEYSSKYLQRSFSCARATKRDLKHSSALTTAERYAEDISNSLRKTQSALDISYTTSEQSDADDFVPLYRVRSQKEITQDVKPLVAEMFACFECRETFSNFSKLRVHFHSRHYCFVCCRFFVKSSCLLKHNKTVHKDKFACVTCKDHSSLFASPESLLIHCSLKHPKQFQIHCPICGFEERCKPKPAEMMAHLRKHIRRDAVSFQKRNSLPIGCSLEIVITLVPQWSRTPRGLLTSLTVDYSMPRQSASWSQRPSPIPAEAPLEQLSELETNYTEDAQNLTTEQFPQIYTEISAVVTNQNEKLKKSDKSHNVDQITMRKNLNTSANELQKQNADSLLMLTLDSSDRSRAHSLVMKSVFITHPTSCKHKNCHLKNKPRRKFVE